jgi:hypothetical protein
MPFFLSLLTDWPVPGCRGKYSAASRAICDILLQRYGPQRFEGRGLGLIAVNHTASGSALQNFALVKTVFTISTIYSITMIPIAEETPWATG